MAREILIAVSEKLDQEEFKKIFEATPYRLIFSENGEDAFQQIKFFKPNLVIADTALSEKTGLQLCQAVKTDQEFKQIPFILVKGVLEEVSESEVDRAHADAILSKPLHEGELLTLADRLMEVETVEKKERSLLDELEGVDDGEIIELMDVVEEPEPRVSIDDFLARVKEKENEKEELPEMPPLESWDKPIAKEEKRFEEELARALGGKAEEAERQMEAKPTPSPPQKAPAGEPLEKVALEDILLKVEKLRPVIEKEFLGAEDVVDELGEAFFVRPHGSLKCLGRAGADPISVTGTIVSVLIRIDGVNKVEVVSEVLDDVLCRLLLKQGVGEGLQEVDVARLGVGPVGTGLAWHENLGSIGDAVRVGSSVVAQSQYTRP